MTLDHTTCEAIYNKLETCGVEPDYIFVAAAGAAYGTVTAYALPDSVHLDGYGYIIETNNGSDTSYDFSDSEPDDSDCKEWLAPDDNDAITIANILGPGAVTEADNSMVSPYRVLVTSEYYGPTYTNDYATGENANPLDFDTIADAQAWIDEAQSGVYVTSHNETGRPDYKIVNY